MSKLFKLKPWLTVPDAADKLSNSFGERVTERDVLGLALDRHLTLSVYFPNTTKARNRIEKIISVADSLKQLFELEMMLKDFPLSFEEYVETVFEDGRLPKSARGRDLSKLETYQYEFGEIRTIEGVFDLPLEGAERLDVHHRFMMLSNGPEITLQNLDGTFVTDERENYYQLQARFSDMPADELPDFERPDRFSDYDYYPAGGLPEDALLVVRTKALLDLESRILEGERTDTPSNQATKKPLISEDRWFDVLGVMAVLLHEKTTDPRMRKGSDNINMAGMKTAIIDEAQKLGLSGERLENLNKDISAALKHLNYPAVKK